MAGVGGGLAELRVAVLPVAGRLVNASRARGVGVTWRAEEYEAVELIDGTLDRRGGLAIHVHPKDRVPCRAVVDRWTSGQPRLGSSSDISDSAVSSSVAGAH